MGVFSKLAGVIGTFFQIGGPTGPAIKSGTSTANSPYIAGRTSGDSAYVLMRGATPVDDNDLVTKQYADTIATRTYVSAQFNGGNPIPSNTATEQFYVVTTSGANATIGQLIWDDGSNTGNATVLSAAPRQIFTNAAFTGGTITFSANATYVWDNTGLSWVQTSGTSVTGAVRTIRYTIGTITVDSATTIAANAIILRASLDVTTPYSVGATISVGNSGTPAAAMATTDNYPQAANIYVVAQDTVWANTLAVRTTIAGAPNAGAAKVLIEYCVPDA